MAKDLYQDQVKALLAKDYLGVSVNQSKIIDSKYSNDNLVVGAYEGRGTKSKSPLHKFFED